MIYYSKYTGVPIFKSEDLIAEKDLVVMPDLKLSAYVIKKPTDLDKYKYVRERPVNETWYTGNHPAVMIWSVNRLNTVNEYIVLADQVIALPDDKQFEKSMIVEPEIKFLSTEEFNEITSDPDNNNLIVIKFGSEWCPGCERLIHSIEKVAKEGLEGVEFYQVSYGAELELANLYNFKTIPFTLFFKNGILQLYNGKDGYEGYLSPEDLKKVIEEVKTASFSMTAAAESGDGPKCGANGCH